MKIPNSNNVEGKTILKKLMHLDLIDTDLNFYKNKIKNSPIKVSFLVLLNNFN
jgi:hypothetical protein